MRLSILQYGDPILRAKGKQIAKIDDHIRDLAANMIETMHAANGIGLAAQQVGEALAHRARRFASRGSAQHPEVKWQRRRSNGVDAACVN